MYAASTAERNTLPLTGMRVLVVDDHAFTTNLIKDLVYAAGATFVQTARSGADALALLRGCDPHLIITDWRMPEIDGLDFTRIVRRAFLEPDPRIGNAQVPIVLLSAHTSAQAVEEARKAGVTEVVAKPFSVQALLLRLASATDKPRDFVAAGDYVGPDRRRRPAGKAGKARRASDHADGCAPQEEDLASTLKRLQRELTAMERQGQSARG
jgi:CheY-like chemotaxis protein